MMMQRFLSRLIPFILAGIAIVAFALGVMLLAYVFLFGALIGLILFSISWIRQKLFPPRTIVRNQQKRPPGRTFDSDEWKNL